MIFWNSFICSHSLFFMYCFPPFITFYCRPLCLCFILCFCICCILLNVSLVVLFYCKAHCNAVKHGAIKINFTVSDITFWRFLRSKLYCNVNQINHNHKNNLTVAQKRGEQNRCFCSCILLWLSVVLKGLWCFTGPEINFSLRGRNPPLNASHRMNLNTLGGTAFCCSP